MSYIHTMKTLEPAVAGEYLVTAAILVAIKSKTSLPVQEFVIDDEESQKEDPREELVTQFLEYRKYKYTTERLTEKAEKRSPYYTKEPMDIDGSTDTEKPLKRGQVKEIDLIRTMQKILERKKLSQKVEKTITPNDTTIKERTAFIEGRIRRNAHGCIFSSSSESPSKSEAVITSMALLGLMKKGQIVVRQRENCGSIMFYPAVGDTEHDEIRWT